MNFAVPPEYADFVSNADSLRNEFKLADRRDEIVFEIHPLFVSRSPLKEALVLELQIKAILEPLMSNYLWHNEPFHLCLLLPDPQSPCMHFRGQISVGGNVEDEWFIVYCLWTLSKAIPSLAISVVDEDGQFLLIEAADYLPSWLGEARANAEATP